MKKILVIGEILVEIMADAVDQSFLEAGTFNGPYPSGAPAIFIDQAAKFGVPAGILSGVGDDDFGRLCLDRLRKDGVDVSGVRIVKERATGVAFVRYNSDGSRNFIYHIDNAACGAVTREDAEAIRWKSIGAFHIMGSSIFNREMYEIHKMVLKKLPKECVISFDPNVRPEILDRDPALKDLMMEFFKRSEVIFTTEEELAFLTGGAAFQEALKICFKNSAQVVVVKKGADGAAFYMDDKVDGKYWPLDVPPVQVTEVDPTGAGDTFAGAFMAGYIQGDLPYDLCLDRANRAGASAVSKRGPMEGTVTLDELP